MFLVADTGGGHRAAAEAVAQRLRRRHPDMSVEVVDPFDNGKTSRLSPGRFLDMYGFLVRRLPFIWRLTFNATNSQRAMRPIRATLYAAFGKNLRPLVASDDVRIIGSFHPLATDLLARSLEEQAPVKRPRSFTLVCDPIDVHAAWIVDGIETTLCPTEIAHDAARNLLGDQFSVLTVHGFPVREQFSATDRAADRSAARAVLGLDDRGPVVLVTGGGEGGGRVYKQVVALFRQFPSAQVIALAGRNRRLLRKLHRLQERHGRRLLVIDWSDEFDTLVKASDVVISKAGPNTISECAVAGVPVVLTSYVPGQEDSNPTWGAGLTDCIWAPSIEQMCAAVRTLVERDGPPPLREPLERSAADEIVDAIL